MQVPCPGVLRRASVPPISCASSAQMARPRPLPPWRCQVPSTCAKRWNSRACWAGSMPRPVSSTSSTKRAVAVGAHRRRLSPPCAVNLKALWARLSRIWRSRRASPDSHAGTAGSTLQRSHSPRCTASGCKASAQACSHARGANGAGSSASWPASMRATSNASLTSRSSRSPEPCSASTLRRAGGSRRSSSSSSAMPSTPVSGVRISCARVARKRPLASEACSASRRSCSANAMRWRRAARWRCSVASAASSSRPSPLHSAQAQRLRHHGGATDTATDSGCAAHTPSALAAAICSRYSPGGRNGNCRTPSGPSSRQSDSKPASRARKRCPCGSAKLTSRAATRSSRSSWRRRSGAEGASASVLPERCTLRPDHASSGACGARSSRVGSTSTSAPSAPAASQPLSSSAGGRSPNSALGSPSRVPNTRTRRASGSIRTSPRGVVAHSTPRRSATSPPAATAGRPSSASKCATRRQASPSAMKPVSTPVCQIHRRPSGVNASACTRASGSPDGRCSRAPSASLRSTPCAPASQTRPSASTHSASVSTASSPRPSPGVKRCSSRPSASRRSTPPP